MGSLKNTNSIFSSKRSAASIVVESNEDVSSIIAEKEADLQATYLDSLYRSSIALQQLATLNQNLEIDQWL